VGVAAIGQGVADARVHDDHDGLCAAEPVGKEIVYPLGDVRSAADPDERRQRLSLVWEDVPPHRKSQQLVGLLVRQALHEQQQFVPAGHTRIVPARVVSPDLAAATRSRVLMCPRWRRRDGMHGTLTGFHCTNPCMLTTCQGHSRRFSRPGVAPPAGFEPAFPPPEAGHLHPLWCLW
jgi:hypothetical protein